MTEFTFDPKDLEPTSPLNGKQYRLDYEASLEKQKHREAVIALHFAEFGKNHPESVMDLEVARDIIGRMVID